MIFRIVDQYQYYLFFSKLLEKLLFNRRTHFFLSDYRIFTEAQNGFRKRKYIDLTIQSFIERILVCDQIGSVECK
jgi:hypothetical protein